MSTTNSYQIDESQIAEPPTRFFEKCKYLGPGFILSASIVGSGELIMTTLLGAEAGFVTLWVILLSWPGQSHRSVGVRETCHLLRRNHL